MTATDRIATNRSRLLSGLDNLLHFSFRVYSSSSMLYAASHAMYRPFLFQLGKLLRICNHNQLVIFLHLLMGINIYTHHIALAQSNHIDGVFLS